MGWKPCERCRGRGKIDAMDCPICLGKGSVRQAFSCPVCSGRYYVPRDPPVRVRCPHCSSLLMTYWEAIHVYERGTVPIPPPGSKVPLGAIGGGTLGLVIAGPIGGLIGAILGGAIGAAAEAPLEAREA